MELQSVGLTVNRQVDVPVVYKGKNLGFGFRADMIVNGIIVIELKSVESLLQIHKAQLITYLKILNVPVGLLINFNTTHLRDGIKRCNPHKGSPPIPPSSCS